MKSKHLIAAGFLALIAASAQADIGYQYVTVGDPGNANDPATGSIYGEVDYTYDIGKYDVTLNQYVTFLNAVAKADPYGLYNSRMTDPNSAGISQSGSSGSYSYSVIGSGNRPVAAVSWFDAARFANWVQNGQLTGLETAATTEEGAYTLDGATSGIILKNANAVNWIPTESEWYKAAYFDPTASGGTGGYWTYATRSNTAPGNVVGNGTNQANFNTIANGFYSVTQSNVYDTNQNYLTNVGAFTNSASAYGTYDQNGDVNNWNDAVSGNDRGVRGGSWGSNAVNLASSYRVLVVPGAEGSTTGFRLASVSVPEPGVAMSLLLAGGWLLARRRRSSAT
ncbi:hypothetical protein CfE428DRAFT_5517 [Chthoniobacter flavus Ellin428]|uniref:Sulfatase-modifying factor enzyme-like domain-containing protein n=1 Tax=Chthoniobacter flavus Ellin428 TaxID=497964 RepID=B4D9C7_9BACT|nr:SUMF1/EgtB/PvdO family nonheme iron enzyme [Chthoniobacter flavus]EDY16888.1 hypothetical protein CfE428DRAFT_5517 [Chthoniobacter flavus Ellin428]TCO87770.1 putative secreted protein with PEP-CTERM sorting signal [Chthoniobacter flavus]